ncbi:MAG: hypothetical protein KA716_09535 [Gloeotrichia echinulata DEX184]|nr:hypothetical protein [Gloeotrichia echinulata DEX184]
MPNNQSDCFLLPPSNNGYGITPKKDGEWDKQLLNSFREIANKLKVQGNTRTVSSIPDIWARPLLMQIALYDDTHPLHQEMKAQWRGMLAAIALAKVKILQITATLVELNNNNVFFKELNSREDSVYQLEGNQNPWQKIYVFLIDGKAVGMTSPSTIVCPSEDGNWGNLGWFERHKGLNSPLATNNFLNQDEKEQLYFWLNTLRGQLQGSDQATKIINLIEEFQDDLNSSLTRQNLTLETPRLHKDKDRFFEESILLGNLRILNTPIEPKTIESSVILKSTANRDNVNKIYVIPDVNEISKQWKLQPQDICIEQENQTRLAAINIDDYRQRNDFLVFDEIFNKEIYFIKLASSYIPGALFPKGVDSITYNDEKGDTTKITPLLPINLKLLQVLTPKELQQVMTIEKIILNENPGVRITINLSLSGNDIPYKVSREYTIKEENLLTTVPILELWPNFRVQGWKDYYAFYGDIVEDISGKDHKTFRVRFPKSLDKPGGFNNISDSSNVYQITQLNDFPPYVICQNTTNNIELGVILLNTPPEIKLQGGSSWKVGVDFGTSFTNVYYNNGSVETKLELSNQRFSITKPTDSYDGDRAILLYKYFLSANKKELPISSILTIQNAKPNTYRLILDGRIYIVGNANAFDPSQSYIKTNLKWEENAINLKLNKIFLSQLVLQITAEAVFHKVSTINWAISYPSAFSVKDLELYPEDWKNIFKDLKNNTPITHNWTDETETSWCSESLASAYYFNYLPENQNTDTFTCIDMGGGTSDISIWQDDKLVHQCSVLLAGKDLFSQFLEQRSELLKAFGVNLDNLMNKTANEAFNAKLNALLLQHGDTWVEKRRELEGNAKLQAQELRLLTTIGISGLYYYIGILLRVLHSRTGGGLWNKTEITPVYVGGNGSRIFHWLVAAGEFNSSKPASKLLSTMLQKGSGFSSARLQNTVLSKKPKDEVASGLVLDRGKIQLTIPNNLDNRFIAGEAYEFQFQEENESEIISRGFNEDDRLELPASGTIEEFSIPKLTNLRQFWQDLHQTLKDLDQLTIIPDKNSFFTNDSELWSQTQTSLETYLKREMNRDVKSIRPEPPFIIALKVLLGTLAGKGRGR